MDDRQAQFAQQRARADTRQLQDLRRADGAGRQDDLAPRLHHRLTGLRRVQLYPGRVLGPIARLDADALHVGVDHHLQVATVQGRAQEGLGGAPAHAATLVHLEVGVAEVVAAVELRDLGDAAFRGRVAPGVQDLPVHPPFLHAQLPAGSVERVRSVDVILGALEVGQDLVPGPAAIAERGPVIVVALLTAHVDHRVDRRAAAQHLAAGVADRAPVEPLVRLGLVAPVGARIADGVQVPDWNIDPEVVVLATGFDQQHVDLRVGREPVGENAAGGTRSYDHVVVAAQRFGSHQFLLSCSRLAAPGAKPRSQDGMLPLCRPEKCAKARRDRFVQGTILAAGLP